MGKRHLRNIKILFILISIFILLGLNKTVQAETTKLNVVSQSSNDYTSDYKRYLELPEKEKSKYITPNPYGTNYTQRSYSYIKGNFRTVTAAASYNKFDLRDQIAIQVKNQLNTQTCWTFPIISGVETNISLTRGYNSNIYSIRHMEYGTAKTFLDGINANGYDREVGSGGNTYMGLSYITSGRGPVLEKDMPFKDSEAKINLSEINKEVGEKIEDYVRFPSIYKKVQENGSMQYSDNKGNSFTNNQVDEIRQTIKEHVLSCGGVTTLTNSSQTQYFNSVSPILATAYYCDDDTVIADHSVTIIGWDDNYAKENFNATHRPQKNGAWLVLNSYGTGFNQGYYYISYEDVMVERDNVGIKKIVDKDYKNIYQYDQLGYNYQLSLNDSSNNPLKTIYTGTIYPKKESGKEFLKEVSVMGVAENLVDIYVNMNGNLSLADATLVASGINLKEEYKTFKLNTPLEVVNNKFAVIIKYTGANGTNAIVATETNLKSNGVDGANNWNTATSKEGQDFVSSTAADGTWQDYSEILKDSNFCVKAFTADEDKAGPNIAFEPNGNNTYKKEQVAKVTVSDTAGVNRSTLRYVWKQSTVQPLDNEFKQVFENGETIKNNTSTGDNWYLWVMAKDNEGNVTYKRSESFYLYNTKPTLPTIIGNVGSNIYTKEDVSLQINGSTAQSGIAKYQYSLDEGITWIDYTTPISFTTNGIYKIIAKSISNVALESDITDQYIVKIDNISPKVTEITEGGLYRSIIPTITDDTEITAFLDKNGVEELYVIDDMNRGSIINETGVYMLTVIDEVGNQTILHFTIDADSPTVTFTPNGNTNYLQQQSTVVNITDANGIDETSLKYIWAQNVSFITEYMFIEDGIDFRNGDTITKSNGSGNDYVLLIMAKDMLGNVALVKSEVFYLDNGGPNPPIIQSNIESGGITNQTVNITIGGSNSPSGIKKYQYSLDDGITWIDITEGEELVFSEIGQYHIIARAINNLDAIGDASEQYVVTISKDAPTISFNPDGSAVYKKEQSTQINVSHTSTLNQDSFKSIWSPSESAPLDNEFTQSFSFGSNVTRNTGSGTWYVWAKATDALGNTAITRSKAFYLDNETPNAPNIISNVQINIYTKEIANVSFSGSSSPSGIKKYKYSLDNKITWTDIEENEQVSFRNDGIYTIYACSVNNVGKTGDIAGPYIIKIDTTNPMVTGVEENGIYKDALPVIQDDTPTEIILIKDGVEVPYQEGNKITEGGNYTLKVTDEVGNETIIHFMIDDKGPTITFEPNGNDVFATTQSTKITITDDSGLDNTSIRYKWTQSVQVLTEETFLPDSIPFHNGDTITKNTDSGDNWYLWVLAKDQKGNISLVKTKKFCLDNQVPVAPTVTASIANGEFSREDVRVNISGSNSPSGIAKYQYSLDNGVTWNDLAVGDTLVASKTGNYHIKARAVNNVGTIGNQSE